MRKKGIIISILMLICFMLFSQEKNQDYPLMEECIISNNLKALSNLIANCDDINQVTLNGHHVFESIFIMDNCEAAEMLFSAGVDIHYRNKDGKTLRRMILDTDNRKLKSLMDEYN